MGGSFVKWLEIHKFLNKQGFLFLDGLSSNFVHICVSSFCRALIFSIFEFLKKSAHFGQKKLVFGPPKTTKSPLEGVILGNSKKKINKKLLNFMKYLQSKFGVYIEIEFVKKMFTQKSSFYGMKQQIISKCFSVVSETLKTYLSTVVF